MKFVSTQKTKEGDHLKYSHYLPLGKPHPFNKIITTFTYVCYCLIFKNQSITLSFYCHKSKIFPMLKTYFIPFVWQKLFFLENIYFTFFFIVGNGLTLYWVIIITFIGLSAYMSAFTPSLFILKSCHGSVKIFVLLGSSFDGDGGVCLEVPPRPGYIVCNDRLFTFLFHSGSTISAWGRPILGECLRLYRPYFL